MKDEGIVQPVSKEMEQLSRRLHQKAQVPRRNPGSLPYVRTLRCVMQRRTKQLSPRAAAYVAGLIDGEGTITLSRLHSNENRRLVVCIASTELQLLTYVLEQTGVGKISRKRTTSERHVPSYCYAVGSRQALTLLGQISSLLLSYKRIRAELALKHHEDLTPRNGKYSDKQLARRRDFERAFLSVTASTL